MSGRACSQGGILVVLEEGEWEHGPWKMEGKGGGIPGQGHTMGKELICKGIFGARISAWPAGFKSAK